MTIQTILDTLMVPFAWLAGALEPVVQGLEAMLAGIPASFAGLDAAYENFYISMVRYACPLLAVLLLVR